MNKIHYTVSGMANNNDKTKIKNALEKLDGISETAIDMARGTIEVGYKEPAYEDNIKSCIEKAGFKIL